jgi:hypothetical protein
MKKILTIIFVLTFITGCFCNFRPTGNISSTTGKDITVTSEEATELNITSDKILALLKARKYDYFLASGNYLRKKFQEHPEVLKILEDGLPCLEDHLGILESYNPEDRSIQYKAVTQNNENNEFWLVTQPVKYTKKDLRIKMTFIKEDGQFKLSEILWNSPDLKNISYLQCFTPFNK